MKALVRYARTFLGTPYKWGGKSAAHALDCSGLAQELLQFVGLDTPGDQNAKMQYDLLSQIGFPSVPAAGAFVFYGSSTSDISHVAMCTSPHTVIEAGGGTSATVNDAKAEEQRAFVKERPFSRRKDVVAILMPLYPEWLNELD